MTHASVSGTRWAIAFRATASNPLRFTAVRQNSTLSTADQPSSSHIFASALLSRPPLLLPPLSPFEKAYYAYNRRIHRALAKPTDTVTDWFYRKGSEALRRISVVDKQASTETGLESDEPLFQSALQERAGPNSNVKFVVQQFGSFDADERSLERRADRTLYLLVKKDRDHQEWQFPQGGVKEGETLVEAAKRELSTEIGRDLDVWSVGKMPAGAFSLEDSPEQATADSNTGSHIFFMPMRAIRGTLKINEKEGVVDWAWLTREEVEERVSPKYWEAIRSILSLQ